MWIILLAFLAIAVNARVDTRCPPPSGLAGPCVITKDSCFPGQSCPEGRVCCPEGCGSVCKLPVKVPNPMCPANQVVGPCVVTKNSCYRDKECDEGFYCCPNGCGSKCVKPGCPIIKFNPNIRPVCALPIVPPCKVDYDCYRGEICCPGICYNKCIKSALTEIMKPGTCPSLPNPLPQCLIFQNDCKSDNDCPANKKCCSLACGIGCKEPILCPPVCLIACPFGNVLDENGCPICQCKETPCRYNALPARDTSGQFINCGRGGTRCIQGTSCNTDPTDGFAVCCPDCSPVLCKLFCPFGFKVDKNGCEYCSCKETPCRYNALPARDSSGQFINCRRGETSCVQGTSCNTDPTDGFAVCCPDCRSICSRLCIYGFKLVNNCPACECKETPCRNGLPPLKTTLGNTVTCDRDGAVASCPKDSTCRAGDYGNYAVCCPDSLILPRKFGCPTPPSRFLVRCNTQHNKCNSNKDCPGGQSCCNNPCGRYCTLPVPIKDGFCPAQPDPSLVDCASLRDRCHLDSDCPDLEKCCSTACGNACQSPMTNSAENPGVCQLQDVNALCSNFRNNRKCNADVECLLYEKCCETKCGKFCLTSETLVVNPGICPSPDRSLNCLYYIKQCNQDGNCPSGQKCCEDNCGTSCKLPLYKPGVCPAPRDPTVVLCPVGSTNECITDPDCPGDNKCCEDPCGKRCDLVRPKPGECPVPPDPSVILCSVDSKDECNNDRDCSLDLKCCDNPCGKRCDLVRPKPGECLVPPDPSVILCSVDSKDECSNDRDCPLDLKCCDNPCGKRCDLVAPKPGVCPVPPDLSVVLCSIDSKDECNNDRVCPLDLKCCDNPCGKRCDLARPKPGECPVPPDPSVVFCFDSNDECSNDRECPLDLKCCDNPCGKRCDLVKPKPGVCPVPPLVLCPIDSKDECSNDRDCPLDQKCCDDPCGKRCDLVTPKQGKCPIDVLLPCPFSNECLVDRDCYGYDVCCSAIGCPRTCVDPAIGGIRPDLTSQSSVLSKSDEDYELSESEESTESGES